MLSLNYKKLGMTVYFFWRGSIIGIWSDLRFLQRWVDGSNLSLKLWNWKIVSMITYCSTLYYYYYTTQQCTRLLNCTTRHYITLSSRSPYDTVSPGDARFSFAACLAGVQIFRKLQLHCYHPAQMHSCHSAHSTQPCCWHPGRRRADVRSGS